MVVAAISYKIRPTSHKLSIPYDSSTNTINNTRAPQQVIMPIIPMRCYTCNKVLANKWDHYKAALVELGAEKTEYINSRDKIDPTDYSEQSKLMTKLGLTKDCCRGIFMSHVDMYKYM